MSKVLSQEEVEALINNLPQEDDESVKKSYKKYDFKEKRSLNFDFEKLDNFADKFCEDLKSFLSVFFMKNMKVKKTKVSSVTLKEFKERLKFPTGIGIFKLASQDEFFLIAIDDTTAFAFIELFFGGISISERNFEDRSFTIIEQKVIKKIYYEIINNLKERLSSFFKSDLYMKDFEMSPQHISFWSEKERFGLIEMDISMDDFGSSMAFLEDVAGKMYFLSPVQAFLENKDLLDKKEESKFINEKMLSTVSYIPLELMVELGKATLELQEILNLKLNDVVILDKYVNQELDVYLEGRLKFKGIHGISKGMHSLKISRKI
jgi:flagellar motor switch protein FliM